VSLAYAIREKWWSHIRRRLKNPQRKSRSILVALFPPFRMPHLKVVKGDLESGQLEKSKRGQLRLIIN